MASLEEIKIKQKSLGEKISLLRDKVIPDLEKEKKSNQNPLISKALYSFYLELTDLELQYFKNNIELKYLVNEEINES